MTHPSSPAGPGHVAPPLTQGYPDLLRIAWRRKWLLALGVVVGLGLGPLYLRYCPTVYRSEAQLLILKKRPSSLPIPGMDPQLSDPESYLSAQQALIKSPLIVDRAIQNGGLKSLPSLQGKGSPRGVIIGGLSVNHDSRDPAEHSSAVLSLSYRGAVADDCGAVLEAVIASYEEFLGKIYRDDSDEIRQLYKQWKNEIEKQLSQKQTAYQRLREQTSLAGGGRDEGRVSDDRLAKIEAEKLARLVRGAEAREQLAALERRKKDGASQEELLDLIARWTGRFGADDPSRTSAPLREQLRLLETQEQDLLRDVGPRHPEVIALRKRIALVRGWLANGPAEEGQSARADPVDAYARALREDVILAEGVEQSLGKLLDTERTRAQQMNNHLEDMEELRRDIASLRDLYQGIIKRLEGLDLLKDAGAYHAQVISPPGSGVKVSPNPSLILAIATALGILLGGGLAFLAEVSDRSFRSPEEVRRRLGFPVVGHLPWVGPAGKTARAPGSALDPVLWTYHQPHSPVAEAYREVRTTLSLNRRGQGCKLIQVTSPAVGDGKTVVAANLAVSLARGGKRVLLVDADGHRPRLHRLFGLPAGAGLTSVLSGQADPAEAIQPSGIPGLSVLPYGPPPPASAEVFLSPRLPELLSSLRERYDLVLLDSSPLLAVTDPCVVASLVDGVLLVLRLSRNSQPEADRAKEVLATVPTPVLGAIVNAVRPRSGFGGYSRVYLRPGADTPAAPPEGVNRPGPASVNGARKVEPV